MFYAILWFIYTFYYTTFFQILFFLLPIWFYVDGVVFSGVASWLLFAVIRSHSRNTMSFNSIPCQLPHHNKTTTYKWIPLPAITWRAGVGVEWSWLPFALWMNRNIKTWIVELGKRDYMWAERELFVCRMVVLYDLYIYARGERISDDKILLIW